MKKIILFRGAVETLAFFSNELQNAFIQMGYETFVFDISQPLESFNGLLEFCKKGEAVAVTFNFIGLSGEPIFNDSGNNFFDVYKIKCINIVVDHPFYYHQNLHALPHDYIQFCIDQTHIAYMKRFFKNVRLGPFLPLAGTMFQKSNPPLPIRNREKIDIIFTGNYTPLSLYEKQITRINDEYTNFYRGIIDDLISNPANPMDIIFEKHIRRDIPDISDTDLAKCMENMIFIDLYIRFYVRGKVLGTLADGGFKITTYGSGLEQIPCKHPENLIKKGSANSLLCLKKLSQSKISLNVMPWFKNGGHDRIFNAALNGAVNLTDSSIFLDKLFGQKNAVAFYDLKYIEELPEITQDLLSDEEKLQTMASNAYQLTKNDHTWYQRAEIIARQI